jgi:hypothetical protein
MKEKQQDCELTGNSDAVDNEILFDQTGFRDDRANLSSRTILSLPSKSLTQSITNRSSSSSTTTTIDKTPHEIPINKIVKVLLVAFQQIAGAKVLVAWHQHVARNLLRSGFGRLIAVKVAHAATLLNLDKKLARLSRFTHLYQTILHRTHTLEQQQHSFSN